MYHVGLGLSVASALGAGSGAHARDVGRDLSLHAVSETNTTRGTRGRRRGGARRPKRCEARAACPISNARTML